MPAHFRLTLVGDNGEPVPFEEGMRFEMREVGWTTRVIWVMSPNAGDGRPLVVLSGQVWSQHNVIGFAYVLLHAFKLDGWRLIENSEGRDGDWSKEVPDRLLTTFILKKAE